ncbi:alpha/beta fold hydrolase [Agromyces sp. SYSU T00194]|uniref:alpha/beta fold hydrolase n=1 Tax=Agromyces chitinivorans TaxID=3158560 RepID=UPI00339B676B
MRQFTDEHGVHIHYVRREAEHPRAVVQFAHGVGEHTGRYGPLFDALVEAGYTVYADDHRGHGQTGFEQHGGDLTRLGRPGPGGLRALIDAVHRLTGIARADHPDLPLILIGHSLGSLVVQILLNRYPHDHDAIVLTGTAYRTVFGMESGDLNKRFRHLGPTPVEWLTRDRAVAEAFMADPYCTPEPTQKLFGLVDSARLLGRPAKHLPPGLPLLIMVGEEDSLGGEASCVRLAEAYASRSGLTDVELIVYPGARHEIFNETNQAEVRADLLAWLDARFPVRT